MKFPTATLLLHGINGTTGQQLSVSFDDVFEASKIGTLPEPHAIDLGLRSEHDRLPEIGAKYPIKANELCETGWGVIFADDEDPKVIEALRPLLDYRRNLATKSGKPHFYREYRDADGLRKSETKWQFLDRHVVPLGSPADPERMPYYLLIVGDPRRISFEFQYELDVEYAVGRLHFDSIEDYKSYAQSVVTAETHPSTPKKTAAFFGPSRAGDVTSLSSKYLVGHLADRARKRKKGLDVNKLTGPLATKLALATLLEDNTLGFLFTASHGMVFDKHDTRLLTDQGALLCADWSGPGAAICEPSYFSASDVPTEANYCGLVTFHFACYGAGTPSIDDFPERKSMTVSGDPIAPFPFVAALPKQLLSQMKGGALAVIAHVERAWTCSFLMSDYSPQTEVFESVIDQLLDGARVGAAMESFNQKYAALATQLTSRMRPVKIGRSLTPEEKKNVVTLWTMLNDSRNYIVLGDPAVRLTFGS
jgi:hypothetical protein